MTRQMSSVWLYRSEGIQAPDHATCRLSQQDRDCCTLSMLSPDQYPSKITNIYAIKALDTLRCMQLRSASLRIDVCADRAGSSASNVFFAPSYLGMPWLSLLSVLTRVKRWQGNDTLTALLGHSAFPVDHGRLLLVSGLRSGAKLLPALRVRKAEMIEIFIRLYQIGLSRILSATSHSRKRKREERSDHRRFYYAYLRASTAMQPMDSPKATDSDTAYPAETLPFPGTACQLCHWTMFARFGLL